MSERTYTIVEDPSGTHGYTFRGAALELWKYRGPEVIIAGAAETGKTLAALARLDAFLWKYPGAQGVMCRKIRDTVYPTVLQTYINKILTPNSPVKAYGGARPSWFDYPKGSRLWIAGLDDPGKALSSERDIIYVNQAEEISEDAWQVLTTRATGRAGNAPYGQVIGDCNPDRPTHWIRTRSSGGGRLKLLYSEHRDNPRLWDATTNDWTDAGRLTMGALSSLTGVRKDRLCDGKWVQAEGAVYDEWSEKDHHIASFPIPQTWPRYWVVDFGFRKPFSLLWAALDGDGRAYVYREIYMTQRLVEDHAKDAVRLSRNEPAPIAVIADHDAEGRETFERYTGYRTKLADKAIMSGIQKVKARLRKQDDDKPRFFVFHDSLVERDPTLVNAKEPLSLADEFGAYVWDTNAGKKKGEVPIDEYNHALDCSRYLCAFLDRKKIRIGAR